MLPFHTRAVGKYNHKVSYSFEMSQRIQIKLEKYHENTDKDITIHIDVHTGVGKDTLGLLYNPDQMGR